MCLQAQDEELKMSLGDTTGPGVKKPTELSQDEEKYPHLCSCKPPDKNHTKDTDEVVGPAGKRKGKGGSAVEVRGGDGD